MTNLESKIKNMIKNVKKAIATAGIMLALASPGFSDSKETVKEKPKVHKELKHGMPGYAIWNLYFHFGGLSTNNKISITEKPNLLLNAGKKLETLSIEFESELFELCDLRNSKGGPNGGFMRYYLGFDLGENRDIDVIYADRQTGFSEVGKVSFPKHPFERYELSIEAAKTIEPNTKGSHLGLLLGMEFDSSKQGRYKIRMPTVLNRNTNNDFSRNQLLLNLGVGGILKFNDKNYLSVTTQAGVGVYVGNWYQTFGQYDYENKSYIDNLDFRGKVTKYKSEVELKLWRFLLRDEYVVASYSPNEIEYEVVSPYGYKTTYDFTSNQKITQNKLSINIMFEKYSEDKPELKPWFYFAIQDEDIYSKNYIYGAPDNEVKKNSKTYSAGWRMSF